MKSRTPALNCKLVVSLCMSNLPHPGQVPISAFDVLHVLWPFQRFSADPAGPCGRLWLDTIKHQLMLTVCLFASQMTQR